MSSSVSLKFTQSTSTDHHHTETMGDSTTLVTAAPYERSLLPKIPISTSPNAYPFDSRAQVYSNRVRASDLLKTQRLLMNGSNLKSVKQEREILHEKSQQAVKSWTNTILGKRKQRLLNIKLRNDAAEQTRIDVDNQWRKEQEQEHADAIQKCKLAQQYQTSAIRNLHSDLLFQDVVAERNLQIALRQKEKLQQRATMRDKTISDAIRERQKLTAARENARTIAQFQLEQIQHNQNQRLKAKEQEKEYNKIWQNKLIKEQKQMEDLTLANKVGSKQREWYDAAIRERKMSMEREKLAAAKEADSNKRFNSIKAHISDTEKRLKVENLKKRQDVIEGISREQWKLQCEVNEKRRAEEDKLLHSNDNNFERRMSLEKEKLRMRLEDISNYNRKKAQEVQNLRFLELELNNQEELKLRELAEHLRAEKHQKEIAEKERKDSLLCHLSLQIEENKERNALERKNSANLRDQCIQRFEKEDHAFQVYALSVAKSLRDCGKSDAVVQRALLRANEAKIKPAGRVFGGVLPDHINTFNRLGFS